MKCPSKIRTLICSAIVVAVPIASLPSPALAAKARVAGPPALRHAARAITQVTARWTACKSRPGVPYGMAECNGEAIEAYDKLLPGARTHSLRQEFLLDITGLFLEAQNADRAYYPNYSMADTYIAVARYADFARRRAEILTGVEKVPPRRKPVRGEPGLFDWIDRTPDLRAVVSGWSTRQATLRWAAIRTADCAAYPVQRCAERLDHEMRLVIRDLTKEGLSSFRKGEKRPPRRF